MMICSRRAIMTTFAALAMLVAGAVLPAAAQAHSATASAGGLKATFSYSGGPGITTKDEHLTIVRSGKVVYDQPVPSDGCFKVCGPGAKQPVAVADLYGDDGEDVVLNLFSGGADCCTIADVYVPSAAVQSYVLDTHSFGEAGFRLENIGPAGRPLFVSADNEYYCSITYCAASGLPLQIFEFEAERFVDVTTQYPKLIARDATRWLAIYYRKPSQGQGAIAAWAGDEYLLGKSYQATVNTVLQRQYADHHLTLAFIKSLDKLLSKYP
jgi:hypothetical protein